MKTKEELYTEYSNGLYLEFKKERIEEVVEYLEQMTVCQIREILNNAKMLLLDKLILNK